MLGTLINKEPYFTSNYFSDLVLLQSEVLPLTLSLLFHALLKLLPGHLHSSLFSIQLLHVGFTLLVHLLSVLQRLARRLQLLYLV